MIGKHGNWKYNGALPYNFGDRYYSQDKIRDFLFSVDHAGRLCSKLVGTFPALLMGGAVSQGAGDTISILTGAGVVGYDVEVPDSFSSFPPSKATVMTSILVEWGSTTNNAIPSAVLDGSTPNYVKIRYNETNGNTRARARAAGTYSYELIPSYTIVIDDVAPTDYEVLLATFTGLPSGTFTISQERDQNVEENYQDIQELFSESSARVRRRQTVITGAVDSDNRADFMATGAGLTATMNASPSSPVLVTWANGNDLSPQNYFGRFTGNRSWTGLTPYGQPKLYLNRDGAGVVTQGHSMYSPQYGAKWRAGAESGAIHANFDDTDGATVFTDHFLNVWKCYNTGSIKTTEKKFGVSSFRSAAIGDYIESPAPDISSKWTIEFWFRRDDTTAASAAVFCIENEAGYGIDVTMNPSAYKLGINISSNGSGWDIVSGGLGTKTSWVNDQWYHFAMTFDGAAYKIYIDGTLDYAFSSTAAICPCSRTMLGVLGPSRLNGQLGYWDEYRYSPDVKYTGAFTPAASAFTPAVQHWFDLVAMKMRYGTPAAWTECHRLFVGECETDGSASSAIITYGINGEYESDLLSWAYLNVYSFNHNLGFIRPRTRIFMRVDAAKQGTGSTAIVDFTEISYMDNGTSVRGYTVYGTSPLNVKLAIAEVAGVSPETGTTGLAFDTIASKLYLICERGW